MKGLWKNISEQKSVVKLGVPHPGLEAGDVNFAQLLAGLHIHCLELV